MSILGLDAENYLIPFIGNDHCAISNLLNILFSLIPVDIDAHYFLFMAPPNQKATLDSLAPWLEQTKSRWKSVIEEFIASNILELLDF